MPGAAATAQTAAFRRQFAEILALIARRIRRTAQQADLDDIEAWFAEVFPQVRQEILTGSTGLAELARRYLRAHAQADGVTLAPVVVGALAAEQIDTSLRVTGPVQFRRHVARGGSPEGARRAMAVTLSGAAQRLTAAPARETITRTVAERDEVAGWRRVSDGDPCFFCSMLISRGAVYSRETVRFQSHDSCGCIPEPLYRREPEPPEVRELYEQWRRATQGTSGAASIRAWRDYWDNRQTTGE